MRRSPSGIDKDPAKVYTIRLRNIIIRFTKAPSCVSKSGFQVRKSRGGGDNYGGIDPQERLSGYQGRLIKRIRKGGNTEDEIKKVVY